MQSQSSVQRHLDIYLVDKWCFIGIHRYDLEQLIAGTGIELQVVGEMPQQFYIG